MLPRHFIATRFLLVILFFQLLLPAKLWAQAVSGGSNQPANLDLSSTTKTVAASGSGTIKEGQSTRSVATTDLLTPAEHVALFQVLNEGKQSIVLSDLGSAVGGSFQVNPSLAPAGLNSLLVPQGVTAIQASATLNLLGNLTNMGSIYAVSQNPQITTSYISAANIFNQQGGLISSVLPSTGLPGITSAVGNLSLHLTAVQDIINAGSIIAAGNLTAVAGGSIINALPAGVTGVSPVMQAMNNLNLCAGTGSIVNSGLLSSIAGNINVTSQLANNIIINNIGGRLEALSGMINVRDALFADKFNLTLWGGDIACGEVNLFSGTGNVNMSVEQILGTVNVTGHTAHITAASESLTLGSITLTGDPTFYNTQGSIVLDRDLVFPAEDIAIIANGDIVGNGIQVIDSSSVVNGGHITLIAGANLVTSGTDPKVLPPDQDTTSLITVVGGTPGGGKIDLSTIPIIGFSSVGQSSSGGDITLAAYGGTRPGSGQVLLPTNCPITTGSGINDINGNVTIIAGASSGTGIITGNINTSGANNGTGSIFLLTANPLLTGCPNCNGSLQIVNGKIISGRFNTDSGRFPQFLASVTTGDLTASGATIDIRAGSNVNCGSISVDGSGTRDGGTVNVLADMLDFSAPQFVIGSSSANGIHGSVFVSGGSAGGGTVGIVSSGSGGILLNSLSSITLNSTSGGQLGLNARNGTLTLPSGPYKLDGVGNGNGGLVNLSGQQGVIFTGSNVAISANGAGAGAGGNIAISGSSIVFPGTATLSANAPGSGNAGRISIYGGPKVELTDTTVMSATAVNGSGGNITLSSQGALTTGKGDVLINASSASGVAGAATVVAGNLTVGTGNVTVNTTTGNGTGGSISWVTDSTTSTNGANISLNASSSAGDGGFIDFSASNLTSGAGAVTLNASSAGLGYGGLVTFFAPKIQSGSGAIAVNTDSAWGWGLINASIDSFAGPSNLALSARATNSLASGLGGGGTVNLSSTTPSGQLHIGGGAGQISINASAASSGSATVDGGIVSVTAGSNLAVDGAGLNARASAPNGNGAQIALTAGSSGQGILQVTGNLDASGVGSGNGSSIALSYADANPFNSVDINGTKVSNTAIISANAPGSGAGGTITLSNSAAASPLAAELHGGMSATSASGTNGTIAFSSATQDIKITGDGSLQGSLNASGKLVSINLTTPVALNIGAIKSTSGDVTLNMQGSQISLATSASKIESAAAISLLTPVVVNGGKITAVSALNISSPTTGDLSISGGGSLSGATVSFKSAGGSVLVNQGALAGSVSGSASRNYSLTVADGGLNVANITTSAGSLSLIVNGGTLTLLDNSSLTAREGNILLQNNSATGAIALRPYATVTAASTTSTSLGRVDIVMGGIPSVPVTGTPPADLTVTLLNGGKIYYGAAGIASGCCNHTARVDGSVVLFDTGAMPSSAISLTTNNSFNASSRPTVVVRPLPPGKGGIPPGHGGLPPGLGGLRPPGLGGTPPGLGGLRPGAAMLILLQDLLTPQASQNLGRQIRSIIGRIAYEEEDKSESEFQPVSYVQPAVTDWTKSQSLPSMGTPTAQIKHTGAARVLVNSSGHLLLKRGEILLVCKEDTLLKAGICDLSLERGAVVSVDRDDEAVKVRVLYDRSPASVKAFMGDNKHSVDLSAGQELIVSAKDASSSSLDGLARRHMRQTSLDGGQRVTTSEFSLVSLFRHSDILGALATSNDTADKRLLGKLMKMGVCLTTVTSSHGAYTSAGRP